MVREEARVGTSIHETVRTSRGNECEVVFVWNFFSFQGAKIKVNSGEMMGDECGDVLVHETASG